VSLAADNASLHAALATERSQSTAMVAELRTRLAIVEAERDAALCDAVLARADAARSAAAADHASSLAAEAELARGALDELYRQALASHEEVTGALRADHADRLAAASQAHEAEVGRLKAALAAAAAKAAGLEIDMSRMLEQVRGRDERALALSSELERVQQQLTHARGEAASKDDAITRLQGTVQKLQLDGRHAMEERRRFEADIAVAHARVAELEALVAATRDQQAAAVLESQRHAKDGAVASGRLAKLEQENAEVRPTVLRRGRG
jgi:chromosome segregation ATPase